jgi:hypothetical protein
MATVVTVTVQIMCIVKRDRTNAHERIKAIGGVNSDRTRWKLSEADAIVGVKTGKYRFYVDRPAGHRINVVIAKTATGHEYLKTEADGEQPNNLLALPGCP